MNFQHVRAFCMIAAEGSISRAAEKLHLTQPTVSAQMQALERSLRARLFERSAQGITLTQAGRLFHTYALQILELAQRTEQALDELQGLQRGRLEIAASTVPGHYVLPAPLARFRERRPGIVTRLVVANSQAVRNGVRDGAFELGMVGERVRDERLTFEPVARDRLMVVMRPQHSLAAREALDPAELCAAPLILREHGSATRATLEQALSAAGVSPGELNVFMELGSAEAIKTAVRAADVLAVVSEWSVRDEVSMGLLRAVPLRGVPLERDLYLIWRAHGYLSVASESFVQFLREEVGNIPP